MKKNRAGAQAKTRALVLKKAGAGSPDFSTLIKYFDVLKDNSEPSFQVLDFLPIPIEIFAADGTMVYTNQSSLDMLNCKDRNLLIGKYNCLKDKVCMDDLGYREEFERAFSHEKVIMRDFPAPIQDLVDRGVLKEKPFEKATMDLYTFPVWKDNKLIFVVSVAVVKSLYLGRSDVAMAKEYIDTNWQKKYDAEAVARHVNIGVTLLYKLFKEHTGMTPGDYHKRVIVEHIKEKLADENLTVKEAFAACNEDSHGWFSKVFKKTTGMSPLAYRDSLK